MDIYLIRHTKTCAQPGLCYGQSDIDLAESFSGDCQALKRKLPPLTSASRVYSSPLSRCQALAQQLCGEISTDERLTEINFGDWEGLRFDDIAQDRLRQWTDNFVEQAPPNGESFADLCRRAGEFWQDMLSTSYDQILVVTHAGTIRALLAQVLDLPPANAFRIKVGIGSVHKLQHESGYTYIDYLNH